MKGKLFKHHYLMASDLFFDFSPEEMSFYHNKIVMESCRVGHVFYTPGETGEVLFLLKEGAAQTYKLSDDGRKLVIAQIPQGSFFGEMGCFGQAMHDSYAEATENSLICTLSKDNLEEIIMDRPKVGLRLLEIIGRRKVETERQLEDLAFKGLTSRMAGLLLQRTQDSDELKGLSHHQLSDFLGVHRETITRALDKLKSCGAIAISRQCIQILDRGLLEKEARK